MAALWLAIQVFIFTVAAPLVARVLISLGIGMVVYTGADFAVTEAETYIFATIGGFPAAVYQIMAMSGLIVGVKMMFAATSAYIAIKVAMGAFASYRARPDTFTA